MDRCVPAESLLVRTEPQTDRRAAERPPVPTGLHRLAVLHLAVATVGTAGFLLTPVPLVRAVVAVSLLAWAAAVVLRATALLRPLRGASSWACLGVAQGVSALGWTAELLLPALGQRAPSAGAALLSLAAYGLTLAGLLALGGLRRHRDRLAVLDTAVLAVAVGVLVWALLERSVSDGGLPPVVAALTFTHPALDVLLVVVVLRLVLAGGTDLRTCLLLAWAATQAMADGARSWHVLEGEPAPGPVVASFLLSAGLLALAAAVPPGVPRGPGRAGSSSLGPAVVLVAVLPLPLLLVSRAVQGSGDGVAVVAVGSAVVTSLVVLRALLAASVRPDGGVGSGAGTATVRLVAAFLVLALLPLAGLTTFAVRQSHAAMDEEVGDRMRVTSAVSAGYVAEELSNLQTLVASYAARRLLAAVVDPTTPAQRSELTRQLRQLVTAHPGVAEARLLDLQGRTVGADPAVADAAPDPRLVREALAARAPYVSPSADRDGARVVTVAAPLRHPDGSRSRSWRSATTSRRCRSSRSSWRRCRASASPSRTSEGRSSPTRGSSTRPRDEPSGRPSTAAGARSRTSASCCPTPPSGSSAGSCCRRSRRTSPSPPAPCSRRGSSPPPSCSASCCSPAWSSASAATCAAGPRRPRWASGRPTSRASSRQRATPSCPRTHAAR
jgi:hypothetical protein